MNRFRKPVQTRGLSDKLDKELERSSKFVDEWDVDGGPFLRTRSEADSHSKDEWDNAKASLMLQVLSLFPSSPFHTLLVSDL
jgi:hypothetical protein